MSSSASASPSEGAAADTPAQTRRARQATNAGAFEGDGPAQGYVTTDRMPGAPSGTQTGAASGDRTAPAAAESPGSGPRAQSTPGAPTQPVVIVQNLGKCYHIYNKPEDRLKQALLRWRGKDFYDEFWALKGVSFEVAPGEAVGVVGRNGSGKSTLMQIIAGTLAPTVGQVIVRGRVAALLELGSGFNPDFTGRENVQLYGAILGLTRREIDERFDEIAAFADIGRFLDQPVKTYSSGMRVRLAFAVQVQVRPEVLIIDEALTVGDNLFQKRCHERLRLLREAGTTLLFVSHQQEIIRTLTSRCVLLHEGMVRAMGAPGEVLLEYRRLLHDEEKRWTTKRLEAAGSSGARASSNGAGAASRAPAQTQTVADPGAIEGAGAIALASSTSAQTEAPAAQMPAKAPTVARLVPALARAGSRADQPPPAPESKARSESEPPPESMPTRTYGDLDATITGVEMLGSDAEGCSLFYPGDRVLIRVRVRFEKDIEHVNIALRLRDKHGVKVHSWGTLNQDIAVRSGLRPYDDPTGAGGEHEGEMAPPASVWERAFKAGQSATVEFEWLCTLGAGFYEVQACVSHEPTPDYRNQRMLHWLDEAAFFEVKVAREEYFFGGMCDLRMRAEVLD